MSQFTNDVEARQKLARELQAEDYNITLVDGSDRIVDRGYNSVHQLVRVTFISGSVYVYGTVSQVPPATYLEFENATSQGKFVSRLNEYGYVKL